MDTHYARRSQAIHSFWHLPPACANTDTTRAISSVDLGGVHHPFRVICAGDLV